MNPYVFVVGCPRSGTTLLRRIGDAHPDLAVVRELHWLTRLWERRIGISPEGKVTRELVDELASDPRFPRMGLSTESVADLIEGGPPKHFARFVTDVFDRHGHLTGKRLVGEKTPGYVRRLRTLHSLWPEAKIVHLVRDGRDVALSVLDWPRARRTVGRFPTWDDDPLTTTALWWEWHVRLGREAARLLGPGRYHELGYESLVAGPERECRRLCGFLGLTYDSAMLRFHEGRTRPTDGRSAKKAWLPVTAGLRDWRDQMAPAAVARFEAAAGPLLDELGYPRGSAAPTQEQLAHASRLREAFGDHARARGLAVPQAWEGVVA
jgi:hypothetical protein